MLIKSTGLVGIGTTAPSHPLTVKSSVVNEMVLIHNESTSATTSDGIKIIAGPNSNPASTTKYIAFYSGDETFMDSIEGDGAGGCRSTFPAYGTWSDIRNKNSIIPIEKSSLKPQEIINSIDVIEFKYNAYDWHSDEIKEKYNTESRIGVSAQQLETVVPYVVQNCDTTNIKNKTHPGDPGYKWLGVKYEELVPLLIQTSKEQNALIQQLENKIKMIEEKIACL